MAKVELKQPIVQAIAEDIKDAASRCLSRLPWTYSCSRTQSFVNRLREAGMRVQSL